MDLVLKTINMQHEAQRGAMQIQREDQVAEHQMVRDQQLHNMDMKHKAAAIQQQKSAAAAKPKAKGKAK
jgi:hypothetical protein